MSRLKFTANRYYLYFLLKRCSLCVETAKACGERLHHHPSSVIHSDGREGECEGEKFFLEPPWMGGGGSHEH